MKHLQASIGFTHFLSRTLFSLAAGLCRRRCPAACTPRGAPQKGGTLVMVVQPEPPTLASYQSTSGPIGQVATKVFDGLLEYDFDLKPIAGLAQVLEGERRTARPSPSSCGRASSSTTASRSPAPT